MRQLCFFLFPFLFSEYVIYSKCSSNSMNASVSPYTEIVYKPNLLTTQEVVSPLLSVFADATFPLISSILYYPSGISVFH